MRIIGCLLLLLMTSVAVVDAAPVPDLLEETDFTEFFSDFRPYNETRAWYEGLARDFLGTTYTPSIGKACLFSLLFF